MKTRDQITFFRSLLSTVLIMCFFVTSLNIPLVMAADFYLPVPGVMVRLSPPYDPPILKGIKVYPNNPFRFEFILDKGDSLSSPNGLIGDLYQEQLKQEASKLIKYFLVSLTVPEKDLWVNLSPYEKNRIIPTSFGLTEMGRDLLAEDYMLKQITASLIYPEDQIGKRFWKRIYEESYKRFGTTNIPVNTFNKVWIVPQKAVVYENTKAGTAYVVESKLKVMLEQDYLSLEKHNNTLSSPNVLVGDLKHEKNRFPTEAFGNDSESINALGSKVVREIVIPELTKEVNENENFARLRQVYNSLILATWYKQKIRDSILTQVYADKNKIAGVRVDDPKEKEKIYQLYLRAFKKGVYNYIKEEVDPATQEMIPRKYFSGGVVLGIEDPAMNSATKLGTKLEETEIPPDLSGFSVGRTQRVDADLLLSTPNSIRSGASSELRRNNSNQVYEPHAFVKELASALARFSNRTTNTNRNITWQDFNQMNFWGASVFNNGPKYNNGQKRPFKRSEVTKLLQELALELGISYEESQSVMNFLNNGSQNENIHAYVDFLVKSEPVITKMVDSKEFSTHRVLYLARDGLMMGMADWFKQYKGLQKRNNFVYFPGVTGDDVFKDNDHEIYESINKKATSILGDLLAEGEPNSFEEQERLTDSFYGRFNDWLRENTTAENFLDWYIKPQVERLALKPNQPVVIYDVIASGKSALLVGATIRRYRPDVTVDVLLTSAKTPQSSLRSLYSVQSAVKTEIVSHEPSWPFSFSNFDEKDHLPVFRPNISDSERFLEFILYAFLNYNRSIIDRYSAQALEEKYKSENFFLNEGASVPNQAMNSVVQNHRLFDEPINFDEAASLKLIEDSPYKERILELIGFLKGSMKGTLSIDEVQDDFFDPKSNPQNAEYLVELTSLFREALPYDKNADDQKNDLAPFAQAIKNNVYFKIGDNLFISPETKSFKRTFMFKLNQDKHLDYAFEYMMSGNQDVWYFDPQHRAEVADEINASFPDAKYSTKISHIRELPYTGNLYGKKWKAGKVQLAVYDYDFDGVRLANVNSKMKEKWAHELGVSLHEVERRIAKGAIECFMAYRSKGYLGGADVHTENIRVGIDRDAEGKPMLRVQFVGDFEDFVKKHASTKYWISSSIAIGAEMLAGKGPKEILQTFVGQLITGFVFFGMWDTVDYYTFFMSPLKYKGLSYLSLSPFEITSLYHTASVELSQNRSLTDRLIDIIPRSIGTGFVFSGVAFSKVMADKTGGGILDVHKIKKTLSGQLAKIMHTANGGIDLSAANNYLQTKTDAASTAGKNGIKFYLSPSMLKQLQNAPGFTPVVVGMHPMTDIKQFLGIENS